MLQSNMLALLLTALIALLWLKLCDYLARKRLVSSQVSRKIIHIGTGPIFVLCWLLFPEGRAAAFYAAVIPLIISIKYLLVGLGIIKDEGDLNAMSRSGDRRELLRGPLYYGIVFVLSTLLFWRRHPAGITALMVLCGGDGFADLVGNAFGGRRLPWSQTKTWVGSLAMVLGGFIFSALIWVFIRAGYFERSLHGYLPVADQCAAAVVESLSWLCLRIIELFPPAQLYLVLLFGDDCLRSRKVIDPETIY